MAIFAFGSCTTFAGLEQDAAEIRQQLREDQLKLISDRQVAWELCESGEITFEEYGELMRQTDECEEEAKDRADQAIEDSLDDAKDNLERDTNLNKDRGKGFLFSVSEIIMLLLFGGGGGIATVSAAKAIKEKRGS